MERQATCEERINEKLNRTVEGMKYAVAPTVCADCGHVLLWDEWPSETCPGCGLGDLEKGSSDNETTIQEWRDGLLEVSEKPVVKVLLSTGGPADFFTVELDPATRELVQGSYHFQDWFDGARRSISQDVLELLAQLVWFGEYHGERD